ncbi:MAG: RNA 2',3'-cyclic phosphodiesterase [bacterium]
MQFNNDNTNNRILIGTFVSADVKNASRDFTRNFKKEARNFKFVNLEQLHVSHQFLGDSVSPESIEIIIASLNAGKGVLQQLDITIDSIAFGFPSQKNPTQIFWTIDNTPELNEFTRKVHLIIQKNEFWDVKKFKDRGKLTQHITIARTKRDISSSYAKKIRPTLSAKLPMKMTIDHIAVIKSVLSAEGPKYWELARFEF